MGLNSIEICLSKILYIYFLFFSFKCVVAVILIIVLVSLLTCVYTLLKRANYSTRLIERNFRLYKQGWSALEMCAPLWHSTNTAAQSRAPAARVQRVTTAAITSVWGASHSEQLTFLGLQPLAERRVALCPRFARRMAVNSRHRDMFQLVDNPVQKGRPPRGRSMWKSGLELPATPGLPYRT